MSNRSFKLTVHFEPRPDGGVRAWSPDLPGFVLSHRDVDALVADIQPALKVILEYRFRADIAVRELENLRNALEDNGIVPRREVPERTEYVAYCQ
jgi:hypothetical protein